MGSPASRRKLLFLCLFLSGAAGLAYEVLWTRILGLYFGHTVYAVTTVLAAFMGGLALGSYLLGRAADHWGNPLRLYAILELAIGSFCLLVPGLLSAAREVYLATGPFAAAAPLRLLTQFTLAFLVLIVPTTFMGGTLPVVARAVIRDPDLAGQQVALLYGANTFGAAAGALAAGYWLLPTAGILTTNLLGAAASLVAGLAALALPLSDTGPAHSAEGSKTYEPIALELLLLWCLGASGAVGMLYQVAWTRALILVIGSSTYGFTCILVTFLAGLAMGSYLYSRGEHRSQLEGFARIQAGIALSAFLLIPFFDRLPGMFLALQHGRWEYGRVLLVQFVVVSAVIFIPTTLMGMVFPCATGILTIKLPDLGRDVGKYYAWNTLGAVVGSVAAGFFLIPYAGSRRTLALGVGVNLALAAVVMARARPGTGRRLTAGLAVAFTAMWLLPPWNPQSIHSGVAIYGKDLGAGEKLTDAEERFSASAIPFSREGISTTVAVVVGSDGNRALLVNGKTDASSNGLDLQTMVKTAFIPMALHPAPREVAVIGLGSGVTAGVAARFRDVRSIDVVELEPAVAQAAQWFAKENLGVLKDPRFNLIIDDGRSFIQAADRRYDVLISEPSNPWISGVSTLFTREFMGTARDRLAPGGLFCMWIQGYRISPGDMKMVLRTFVSVFPNATLWQGSVFDYILLGGQDAPSLISISALRARLEQSPGLSGAAFLAGDLTADTLIDSFVLGPEDIRAYAGTGLLNTDDRDYLQFSAPRSLYSSRSLEIEEGIWQARSGVNPPFIRR